MTEIRDLQVKNLHGFSLVFPPVELAIKFADCLLGFQLQRILEENYV